MIIFSPPIQFQMTMLNFTASHKVKVMEPNDNKYESVYLIVCEKTNLEVDFFQFPFQFLTRFLNLSHFSLDMEIHEGNMAKDQDGTQQDKNKSQKCGLCSYSSKWSSALKCHMMIDGSYLSQRFYLQAVRLLLRTQAQATPADSFRRKAV